MQNRRPTAAGAAFFKPYQQKRRQVIQVLPGEVVLRVVCHASVVGGLIGSNGGVVSQLRRETDTKIHCDAPVEGSEHWIVYIVGSSFIDKRVVLTNKIDNCSVSDEEDWVDCKASAVQAALVRVLERVWTVLAGKDGDGAGDEEAYCGMLADRTQVGAVLGKGGKNVEWMRGETGAKIRILPPPLCGSKGDELIQITGGALAVKKALILVSGCLQECPPTDGHLPPFPTKELKKLGDRGSKDPHLEFFPHLSSFLPPMNGKNAVEVASTGHLSSTDTEGSGSTDAKDTEQKVAFRMICTNAAGGGIIGKKGAIVRALRNETGASIVVGSPSTVSGERVVTVSANENLESWYSPAQNALVLVFARSVEIDIENGLLPGLHDGTVVKARLLVPSEYVDCSNRNRGEMLSEMIEVTGADIQVAEGEHTLDCVSENEVVMEIVGEYKHVQNALVQVTAKLRDKLLSSKFMSEVRASGPYGSAEASCRGLHQPSSVSPNSSQDRVRVHDMESSVSKNAGAVHVPNLPSSQTMGRCHSLLVSNDGEDSKMIRSGTGLDKSLDYLLPAEVLNEVGPSTSADSNRDSVQAHNVKSSVSGTAGANLMSSLKLTQRVNQLGLSSNRKPPSPNLCPSNKKSVSVRKITLEIAVGEDAFVTLCGRGDSSLNNLRQVSGAKVDLHDPTVGEAIIVISGSPEQVWAATRLLVSITADQ